MTYKSFRNDGAVLSMASPYNLLNNQPMEHRSFYKGDAPLTPTARIDSMNGKLENGGGFSHKAAMLSTDMRCYFGCSQGFKKDYDLRLHLKIQHKNEDTSELERAYQDAEEEISLTKRSLSVFQCALCPQKYSEVGPFYGHLRKVHNMQWLDYKAQYGRCEIEQGSLECKICSRVVKYDRDTVDSHLKKVHSIDWISYLDRIRKMRQGEQPKELPNIELFECKICNASVKFIFREGHLKRSHKISESEYVQLYKEELACSIEENSMQINTQAEEITGRDVKPKMEARYPINADSIKTPALTASYNNSEGLPRPPKEDIKDKMNKTCSSCAVTFESRRLFIEHCTTDHNMKFRTISGVTICAPLNPQPMLQPLDPSMRQSQLEDDGMVAKKVKLLKHTSVHNNEFLISQHNSYKKLSSRHEDDVEEYVDIGSETRSGRKVNKPKRL